MSLRRTLAALGCGVLLLAGCSDEPEPRFEPTESPSATESSEEPEAQTAEEFIEEWFARAAEAQNSGDTQPLADISRGCRPCFNLIGTINDIYGAGGTIRIDSVAVKQVRPASKTQFDVTVDAAETVIRREPDAKPERIPANTNRYVVYLRQADGAWHMANYLDTPS